MPEENDTTQQQNNQGDSNKPVNSEPQKPERSPNRYIKEDRSDETKKK